ncbi:MAG: hypothetical protein RLZZ387_3758 [Chloroflexota bacterium]|jgi:hypothetical protein
MTTITPPPAVPDLAPAERPRRAHPRPARRRPPDLGGRATDTLAALGALALAGTLWWTGATLTLLCLRQLGAPVDALGVWQWGIPATMSAIELSWWPGRRRISPYQVAVFSGVSLLDLASTLYGLVAWGRGRSLPLGTGIALPSDGAGLIVPAALASVVLTFVPERLARWAFCELLRIWEDADDAD